MDLVSVVIPVYNTGEYLRACLESVVNQTYTNLEIIVVDDGSTDQLTLDILQEFEQKDSRIKVIYSPKNQGLSVSRNIGTEQITGSSFTYLDSDDRFKLDYIERMHNALVSKGVDFVACNIHNFVLEDSVPYEEPANWGIEDGLVIKLAEFRLDRALIYMPIRACALMLNTERYQQANMSFEPGLIMEDTVWCLELFLKMETFCCLDYIGIDRLLRKGSLSHERDVKFYLEALRASLLRKELLKQFGLYELQKLNFMNVARHNVFEALKAVKEPQAKAQIVKLVGEILEDLKAI